MKCYSYDDLLQDLLSFPSVYTVGRSAFGRRVLLIRVGEGEPKALFHGAIHAREYITTPLLVAIARAYGAEYRAGMPAIDFVPMVNPDGVELCQKGVTCTPNSCQRTLVALNGGEDFALWKANGRAVDLNVNFPARWGKGTSNVFAPAASDYVGEHPASESEVRALMTVTKRYRYPYTLSYHCKGEVIYYGFGEGARRDHSRKEALALADLLGYASERSLGSCGGYKDWYALNYPEGVALTVEVGRDDYPHPYPYGDLPSLIRKHTPVASYVARRVQERSCKRPL